MHTAVLFRIQLNLAVVTVSYVLAGFARFEARIWVVIFFDIEMLAATFLTSYLDLT